MNDVDEIIKKFGLESVEEEYNAYLARCRSLDENDIVYHYTNFNGLKGILSSQRLWLTDYKFLNDPSEICYSISSIREVIEENHDGFDKMILQKFAYMFEQAIKKYLICTISFCLKKDYLSAWRWYIPLIPQDAIFGFHFCFI